jgi:hypothetical protein
VRHGRSAGAIDVPLESASYNPFKKNYLASQFTKRIFRPIQKLLLFVPIENFARKLVQAKGFDRLAIFQNRLTDTFKKA